MGSFGEVSRKTFRLILVGLLVISGGFATWSWTRPYEWGADSQSQCRIVGCEVVADHDNYWVNLHLMILDDDKDVVYEHDLIKPVRLLSAGGGEIEPADTTLEGDQTKKIRKIWLRFWLEKEDLQGPLTLRINDGKLKVRSGGGEPKLRSDGSRYFVTHRW